MRDRRLVIIDLDVGMPSKRIIETLRERIAELEELEATGEATSDTCEILDNLHELLDRLYTMYLDHVCNRLH
jgi:hypothetical protein